MPQHILILVNKETEKIVAATFAYTPAEVTMITREKEDEKHYVKTFLCDYSMRGNTVAISNLKPKYILLLKDHRVVKEFPTNFSSATFACTLEEVADISREYNCSVYGIKTVACDYSMRGGLDD